MNKPEDNTMEHNVEVFAGAVGNAASITNQILGTATYAGPAAGKYATSTFTAGVQEDAAVGHFTANTILTAKFGTVDAPGTIDGSVTGFVLDDDTSPAWKVMLEEVTLENDSAIFSGTSEVDFGGGPSTTNAGTWQGTFYGAANDANDEAPSTVVGTFDAVVPNASVIGGFGATKQ